MSEQPEKRPVDETSEKSKPLPSEPPLPAAAAVAGGSEQQQQPPSGIDSHPTAPEPVRTLPGGDVIEPIDRAPPPAYTGLPPGKEPPMNPEGADPPVAAMVTRIEMLTDQPAFIDCPFCHQRAKTTIQKEGTSMQVVAGVLCCLLCVCLTCVPCLAGWFEETYINCSHCHRTVAMIPSDGGPVRVMPTNTQTQQPSKYAQQ
ncbi:hypothetical protein F4778DRAFT_733492 [Xylariomycetidae sp. FL2044]|nr:hypothetical protein F4778DRAFT_733492 [Xylariomycetidae sp. FL2044]